VAAAAAGVLAVGRVVQLDRVFHPIRSLAWDALQAAALLVLAGLALDLVWSVAPVVLRAWRLTRRLVATFVVVAVIGFALVGVAQYFALRVYLEYQMAGVVRDQARASLDVWANGKNPKFAPPELGGAVTEVSDRYGTPLTAAAGSGARGWVQPPFREYPGLLTSYLLVGGRIPGALVDDIPQPVYELLSRIDVPPAGSGTAFATLDGPNGPVMLTAYAMPGQRVLLVESPLAPIDQQLRADMLIYGFASCAALVVIVALALRLTSVALAPLRKVARVADEISAGAYDRRTGLHGSDEVGIVAAAVDRMVDRLQEQIAQVSESEASMKRFLADASHELRTPVTGILGHLEVMRLGAADDPDELRRSLASMHTTADRLARLVHDLLSLGRLDRGEVAIRADPLDVGAFLADAARAAEPSTREHVVELAVPDVALTAVCDRDSVERIIVNLLDNAAKYSPDGSRIRLSARANGTDHVEILVRDEGRGVPEGDRERIFERLYRGDQSRVHGANGGAGLGLAICRALARGQRGDVTVVSRPGPGSTFALRLPRAVDTAPATR
jgi:two-component system OmpR family sensor kinase